MLFCSCVIFLLVPQWLIERLSSAMGAALVGNNFSPIPSKLSFHNKKWLVVAQIFRNLQSIKTLLTLELSQYSKKGSTFSSTEPLDSWGLLSCFACCVPWSLHSCSLQWNHWYWQGSYIFRFIITHILSVLQSMFLQDILWINILLSQPKQKYGI